MHMEIKLIPWHLLPQLEKSDCNITLLSITFQHAQYGAIHEFIFVRIGGNKMLDRFENLPDKIK